MLMKLPHHTEINEIPRSHCSTDIDGITDTQIIPYVPAVQGKDKAKQAAKQLQQVILQQPNHSHLTCSFFSKCCNVKWSNQICTYETEDEDNAKISISRKEKNMPKPIFYIKFNQVELMTRKMVGLLVSLGSFAKAG